MIVDIWIKKNFQPKRFLNVINTEIRDELYFIKVKTGNIIYPLCELYKIEEIENE